MAVFGTGHLEVAGVFLLWGSSSLFIRWAGESAQLITFGRYFIGTLAVLAYGLITRQKDWSLGTNPKLLVVLSVYSAIAMFSYTTAIQFTTVANATLIVFSSAVFVPFLARWWLKESVRPVTLVALALALSGILLILASEVRQFDQRSLLGVMFAVIAAGGAALLVVGVRLVRRSAGVFSVGLYRTLLPGVILLPFAVNPAQGFNVTPQGLACIVMLGVFNTGVANLIHAHGLARIQAQDAAVLTYLEPLGAIALAALFLGESLSLRVVLGAGLIMLAGYLVSRHPRRPAPGSEPVGR